MSMAIDLVLLGKFLRFCLVGFSGVAVDFGFTWLFKEKCKVPKYWANALGFTIAATTNYIFNRMWTFHSVNPEIALEYTKFIIVSLIGLGLNTLVIWLLIRNFKMNFYLSKVFAIGLVTIWNFLANLLYTFV